MAIKKGEVLERNEIPREYKWDLKSMYESDELWEKDFNKVKELSDEIIKFKGKVVENSNSLYEVLTKRDKILRLINNVFAYTHMRLDEDSRNSTYQALNDRAMNLSVLVSEKTSFIVPEILTLSEKDISRFFEEKEELKLYGQYLKEVLRQKQHVLSPTEEALIAQTGEIRNASSNTFSMLNNADLKFPVIKDEKGQDIEITHGNFVPLLENKNREVRKNAYKGLYGRYKEFENTFVSTLNGCIKGNIFNAKVRSYDSSLEAAIDENNIPVSVYDNLIDSVHENLDAMHKYMDIRKKALGVDELHFYDVYTPIVKDVDIKVSYEEAKDIVLKGLEPLGKEYLEVVKEGFNSRWIDVYENRGKRSGAYSSGSYDSKPFILLNYHETLDNIFTIAHEMGHSVHSYFTRKNQPFIYGGYSIFVAEVASTLNEAILINYLLENVKDDNERLYLINHFLEQFKGTVYRQTMFAEFERDIYKYVEEGGALTADYLIESYKGLNRKYYGPNIVVDDEIGMEWARIPHFYYNYYVYQYATGFSAAIALSQKILKKENGSLERYLNFLKSGSSDYPINVLKNAGVNMADKEPVNNALGLFKELVEEMDRLI